tara:strand:+ start:48 stop:587 length:540 start_codon:yes stop_codon:yes gene_type:complete
MWALVENNKVSKVYNKPRQLTIGDIKYPSNIHSLWSEEELKAIGIYEVIIDNTNYKDPKYYINTDQSFAFGSNKVTASYGTATARDLDTLKTNHCETIDNQAYGLLQPNDWMVVRNAESSKAIPSDWLDFRVNVRSTASSMKTKVNAVSDVDALAALYVYNDQDPPTRPLGEWPTQPTS